MTNGKCYEPTTGIGGRRDDKRWRVGLTASLKWMFKRRR